MVTATQVSVYVCMDMCNSVIVWADWDPAADLNLTQNINNCSRFQHLPSLWHQGTVPQYCTEGDRLVSSVPLSEARSQVLNALALSNETRWLCTSSQESSVCLSPCLNSNYTPCHSLQASSKHRISEVEIQRELQSLGKELDALEQKGVELEPQLRDCEGGAWRCGTGSGRGGQWVGGKGLTLEMPRAATFGQEWGILIGLSYGEKGRYGRYCRWNKDMADHHLTRGS